VLPVAVQVQVDQPVGDDLVDIETLVGAYLGDVRSRNIFDRLDIARQQRGNP
jgi:hypothetical protein